MAAAGDDKTFMTTMDSAARSRADRSAIDAASINELLNRFLGSDDESDDESLHKPAGGTTTLQQDIEDAQQKEGDDTMDKVLRSMATGGNGRSSPAADFKIGLDDVGTITVPDIEGKILKDIVLLAKNAKLTTLRVLGQRVQYRLCLVTPREWKPILKKAEGKPFRERADNISTNIKEVSKVIAFLSYVENEVINNASNTVAMTFVLPLIMRRVADWLEVRATLVAMFMEMVNRLGTDNARGVNGTIRVSNAISLEIRPMAAYDAAKEADDKNLQLQLSDHISAGGRSDHETEALLAAFGIDSLAIGPTKKGGKKGRAREFKLPEWNQRFSDATKSDFQAFVEAVLPCGKTYNPNGGVCPVAPHWVDRYGALPVKPRDEDSKTPSARAADGTDLGSIAAYPVTPDGTETRTAGLPNLQAGQKYTVGQLTKAIQAGLKEENVGNMMGENIPTISDEDAAQMKRDVAGIQGGEDAVEALKNMASSQA